ncbi:MAG: hypothetical protein R3B06_03225 [Kofleriaceae bacterium]
MSPSRWRVALAVLVIAPAACGRDRASAPPGPLSPTPPTTAPAPAPPQEPAMPTAPPILTYEGVTLRSTVADLLVLAAANHWRHNVAAPDAPDQQVTVFTTPEHPVKRYRLGYEAGRLVNIQIDYRAPDPTRATLRDQFTEVREVRGAWFLTDADHTILASVAVDGATLRALDLANLRDRAEGEALLRAAFAPPPASDAR